MKILGILCAKKNSNRYKYKSVALWKQSYEKLENSTGIDDIAVAADFSIPPNEIPESYFIYRPRNASGTEDSIINIWRYVYYHLDDTYDYIVCLFPNTVNIKSEDIDKCLDLIKDNKLQEVRGVDKKGIENGLFVFTRERLLSGNISSYIGIVQTEGKEVHYIEELS